MQALRAIINYHPRDDEIRPEMIADENLADLNIIILKVIFYDQE